VDNKILELINDYNNPYIALAQSLNNNGGQGKAVEQLLLFLTTSTNANINDKFLKINTVNETLNGEYFRGVSIRIGSILEVLGGMSYENGYDWFTNKPANFFDILEKAGFDFTVESTNWLISYENFQQLTNRVKTKEDFFNLVDELSVQKTVTDPVFGQNSFEERNICLIGHAYKQMLQNDFEDRVTKHKTLHNAVASSNKNLIKFIIDDCKVNPNIKDENLATPLFYCRDPETLEVLGQYKINWFSKNVLGKDCVSSFTGFYNKEHSNEMIDFAQKMMAKTVNDFQEEEVSQEYIKNRIKQSLLEMVQANRTKKELEDFIKKNKVTSFSDIFDDEGNSLAQICLKKHNWARYEIFKNSYPLDYKNKDGNGYLEILFSTQKASYLDKASNIMSELLDNDIHKKNGNFSFNLILNYFKQSKSLSLPQWYFGQHSKISAYTFAKSIVGEEYAGKFAKEYQPSDLYGYGINSYEKESQTTKPVAYLLLTHSAIYGNNIDLNVLPIGEIFTENRSYYSDKMELQINSFDLYNFLAIIETIEENPHLQKFDYSKVWEKFEQSAVEHLIKDYHARKNDNINQFITNNKFLMNTLLDRDSELFKSMISDDFIRDMHTDRELSVKFGYVLLSSEIQPKEGRFKKATKI
jgi:hypothetical protein